MKMLAALKTGIIRMPRSLNGVLVTWFVYLMMTYLFTNPARNVLNSGFGQSMIVQRMEENIDIEVLSDLGPVLKSSISSISSGFVILIIAGFIINAFFSGGFFKTVRKGGNSSLSEFFHSCSRNFWPFLFITLFTNLITLFMIIMFIAIPGMFIGAGDQSETAVLKMYIIAFSLFILVILPFLVLVNDYARAWQVENGGNKFFRALGFGFGTTIRTFLSSWPLMLVVFLVQLLYLWLAVSIIPGMTPSSAGGIFMLFLVSQLLLIGRLLLRVFRYGCVTSLMEQSFVKY